MLLVTTANAEPSRLWGYAGERWDPGGRLPDFSYAGYRAGEASIPRVPVVANVRDFGASGDGTTDDTAAFRAAIATATAGAVLVPRGRYRLDGDLRIDRSGVVLLGEGSGEDGSVLQFTQSLAAIYEPRVQWSWSGGLIHLGPDGSASTQLATIRSRLLRGHRTMTVTSTDALAPGMLVRLELTDDDRGSLGSHLHADQARAGQCSWQNPLRFTWPVRIASIDGTTVHLDQPLRTEIRSGWQPRMMSAPRIEEVGVEHLRIEMPDVPYAGHHNEPGYNAIYLTEVVHGWIRDVTIVNADSGVIVDRYSKWLTVEDVHLEGRPGHHGIQLSFVADSLIHDFTIDNDWIHAITISHRASGNVVKHGTARFELEMDHHRDSPIENLWSGITSTVSYRSSGSPCAGPHSGARGTFWDMQHPVWLPPWGYIQTNVIGTVPTDPQHTDDAEWYEPVPDLEPADLHAAQLARRTAGAVRFAEGDAGARAAFDELVPERWLVWPVAGDLRYFLGTTRYDPAPGGGLGAQSILRGEARGDVRFSALVRTAEHLQWNDAADVALIAGHQSSTDYCFALFAAAAGAGGLYCVVGGRLERLAESAEPALVDQSDHTLSIQRVAGELSMWIDGRAIARAPDTHYRPGRVGFGALDDAAWFDDPTFSRPIAPAPDAGPVIADALTPDAEPVPDASAADGGATPDAGVVVPLPPSPPDSCACSTKTVPQGNGLGAIVVLLLARKRKRRCRSRPGTGAVAGEEQLPRTLPRP